MNREDTSNRSHLLLDVHALLRAAKDSASFIDGAMTLIQRHLGCDRLALLPWPAASLTPLWGQLWPEAASLIEGLPSSGTQRARHPGGKRLTLILTADVFSEPRGLLVADLPTEGALSVEEAQSRLDSVLGLLAAGLPTRAAAGDRLAEVLETLPDGVILTDHAGNVQLSNAAGRLILGRAGGMGTSITRLFAEPQQAARWLSAGRRHGGTEGDYTQPALKGSTSLWITVRPLVGSTPAVLVWAVTDLAVMDLRRTNTLSRRHQRTVAALAAGTAHELNNPLTGVMGFAQLLQEEALDPQAQRCLQLIVEQVRRCQQVIRNLLMFGEIYPIEPALTAVGALVRRAWRLGGVAWHAGPVQLNMSEATAAQQVLVDEAAMARALYELMRNSVDAMPDGGQITVDVQPAADSQTLQLSLADTGHGMAPEVSALALDPFFTTREVGQGTGMGLSIAAGIVRQHGGNIEVESVPWGGTTVFVFLPRPPSGGPR